MDEQSAITYLLRRKESLNRDIMGFRENLQEEIKTIQVRLNDIPPSAYVEAQRLIDSYKAVLKALEVF